jgi:hypothetical protein
VRAAIHRGENEITLIQQLGPDYITLRHAGRDKALAGITSWEEVMRVTEQQTRKRLRWPCFAIRRWTRRAKPAAAFSRPTPPATPASCCGKKAGWRWKSPPRRHAGRRSLTGAPAPAI